MDIPPLKRFKITGDISVEPVTTRITSNPHPFIYLIMGPTGAGKSSFIEALAGESQKLSISMDQLEGYTQAVTAYRLVNVSQFEQPVYLIDTPGFSDPKISEIEIVNMVRKWLEDENLDYVQRILFLTPITDPRLTRRRGKTIEMLYQFLAPSGDLGSVVFITTMWDTLHDETRKQAESHFTELQDKLYKELFGKSNVAITQFTNSKISALQAMDAGSSWSLAFSQPTSSASPHLYEDLHQRIEESLAQKKIIETELKDPEARINDQLREILERSQKQNHETLAKFTGQLVDFGRPPPRFNRDAQRLRKTIAEKITQADPLLLETLQQWAEEPDIEGPAPDEQPEPDSTAEPLHQPNTTGTTERRLSGKLALESILRHLLNLAKHRGAKWLKRKD